MKEIKLAVFDMAGTTVNEDNVVYKTVRKALARSGVEVTLETVLEFGAGKEKFKAISEADTMVMVPMSDGVRLATDVYLPKGEGSFPVIFVKTPYNFNTLQGSGFDVDVVGDLDGLVHLSDLDWSRPGEEALKDFRKGDMVKAVVLDVDVDKERISLGIKQLDKDPFTEATQDLRRGQTVTCTVTKVVENGLEVSTADGAKGFIRKSEIARDRQDQ
ncbi:MAG: hypothetical protein DSY83_11095, partial [Flavobacteriia bacterium]